MQHMLCLNNFPQVGREGREDEVVDEDTTFHSDDYETTDDMNQYKVKCFILLYDNDFQ